MQKIKLEDGTFVRAFCLVCYEAGRPWVGGELCEHFETSEPARPQGVLVDPELFPTSER